MVSYIARGRLILRNSQFHCCLVEIVGHWGWGDSAAMVCEWKLSFPKRKGQVNGRQAGLMAFVVNEHSGHFYPVNY